MQCPAYVKERELMHRNLEIECPIMSGMICDNPNKAFAWIMGREVDGVSMEVQNCMMEVCGYIVCEIYMKCLRNRAGIG